MQQNVTIILSHTCLQSTVHVILVQQKPALVVKPRGSEYRASYQSQGRASDASAHCVLVLELLRKTQHSQALMKQCFTHIEKRQSKISSYISSYGCRALPLPLQLCRTTWPMCTPLSCSRTPTLKLVECLRAIAIHA